MVTLYNFLESLALQDQRLRTLEKVLKWWSRSPDPDSPISSCFMDDWMVIDAKYYKDFPKQSIAVVKDGYVLFKNNGNGRVKKAGIYDGGTYNRDTNLKSLEYGVDFDDSDLVLVCKYKVGDKIGYGSKDLNISDDQLIRRLKILKSLVFTPASKELQVEYENLSKKFGDEVLQAGFRPNRDLAQIKNTIGYVAAIVAYYDLKDVRGVVNHLRDIKGSNQVMRYNFNKLKNILNSTLKGQLDEPMYRLVYACVEFMSTL